MTENTSRLNKAPKEGKAMLEVIYEQGTSRKSHT